MADQPDETPPRGYTTEDVEAQQAPQPRRRHTGKKILAGVILIPILVIAAWTAIAFNWTYSDGNRVGYVQKISRKGWLCKTWEGELAMSNVPGQMPEKFLFTVRDDAVAKKIEASQGQRVSLHYEQHVGIPTSCFGETAYWVTDVQRAGS